MAKKNKLWIAVIGGILLLSFLRGGGWIPYRLSMLNGRESIDTKDREHFEPIVTSIANKDSSTLCSMFAQSVQESDSTLNDDIRNLFEFISGDIADWDVTALYTYEGVHRGKKQIQYRYAIQVTTTKHIYNIRVTEQARNDFERSSIGLVSLEAYDKANPDVIVRVPAERQGDGTEDRGTEQKTGGRFFCLVLRERMIHQGGVRYPVPRPFFLQHRRRRPGHQAHLSQRLGGGVHLR